MDYLVEYVKEQANVDYAAATECAEHISQAVEYMIDGYFDRYGKDE